MNRLTTRNSDGAWDVPLRNDDDGAYIPSQEIIDRLAAYEETGLEPEEAEACKVALMGKSLAEVKEIEGISVERMKELAKAEAEGRLLVLPCKMGDTVWFNTYKNNATEYVGIQPHKVKRVNVCLLTDDAEIPKWEIGKTVFLTREDAEKALEGMDNDER